MRRRLGGLILHLDELEADCELESEIENLMPAVLTEEDEVGIMV